MSLLAGVEDAIAGYRIAEDGLEASPIQHDRGGAWTTGIDLPVLASADDEQEFARRPTKTACIVRRPNVAGRSDTSLKAGAITGRFRRSRSAGRRSTAELTSGVFDDMDLVSGPKVDVVELRRGIRPWALGRDRSVRWRSSRRCSSCSR